MAKKNKLFDLSKMYESKKQKQLEKKRKIE